jgi:uracil-DNA glycosylase family 4
MSLRNKDTNMEANDKKRNLLLEIYQEFGSRFCDMEIVYGDGNPDSGIVFIGEAPGKDEVKLKKPFVGSAGKILRDFLERAGFTRQDIYITNAVKYRLFRINEKTGNKINRPAKKEDLENCRPYLIRELLVLSPKIIATLGNVPLQTLMGTEAKIGEVHGKKTDIKIEGKEFLLYPLYHPASLIYNRSLEDVYRQDLSGLENLIKQLKAGERIG